MVMSSAAEATLSPALRDNAFDKTHARGVRKVPSPGSQLERRTRADCKVRKIERQPGGTASGYEAGSGSVSG